MKQDPIQIKFQNRQNPQAEFDMIDLGEIFHRKDLNHSPFDLHLVNFYLIVLFEEGKSGHTIDFSNYNCERGSLITIRKDQIHRFHNHPAAKGKLLLFTDDFLLSYLEKLEALKSLQLFNELLGEPKIQLNESELNQVQNLIQRISQEYFKTNDEYSLGIIRSELHILLAKLYRIKSQRNQIIENRKYLEEFIKFQNLVEKYANLHSKVKTYADMMNVSSKTLNAYTQAIVHKSAKEFIDEICTKQIKRLLINTELSVKEIAYASGFEETTNFYKYFKRQTSFTPEGFRESAR